MLSENLYTQWPLYQICFELKTASSPERQKRKNCRNAAPGSCYVHLVPKKIRLKTTIFYYYTSQMPPRENSLVDDFYFELAKKMRKFST